MALKIAYILECSHIEHIDGSIIRTSDYLSLRQFKRNIDSAGVILYLIYCLLKGRRPIWLSFWHRLSVYWLVCLAWHSYSSLWSEPPSYCPCGVQLAKDRLEKAYFRRHWSMIWCSQDDCSRFMESHHALTSDSHNISECPWIWTHLRPQTPTSQAINASPKSLYNLLMRVHPKRFHNGPCSWWKSTPLLF